MFLKVTSSPNGTLTSSPFEPRYQWHDTNSFKYADTQYVNFTNGVLRDNPNDIWFVGITYNHGVTDDEFDTDANNDDKYMQMFYKRTSQPFINKSKKFKPTSYSAPANWTSETDFSRIFQNNAMFIFGCCGQSDILTYHNATNANWLNKKFRFKFSNNIRPTL
jgi:hypothetical protein